LYKFRNILSTYGEQDFEHLLNKCTFRLRMGVWTNGPVESLFQLINVTFYQMLRKVAAIKLG